MTTHTFACALLAIFTFFALGLIVNGWHDWSHGRAVDEYRRRGILAILGGIMLFAVVLLVVLTHTYWFGA